MTAPNVSSLAEVGVILANCLHTDKIPEIYTQMAALRRILREFHNREEKNWNDEDEDEHGAVAYVPSLTSCLVKLISSTEVNASRLNGIILQSVPVRKEWIGCILLLLSLSAAEEERARKNRRGKSKMGLNTAENVSDPEVLVMLCMDVVLGRGSVPSLRPAALELAIGIFQDEDYSSGALRAKLCTPWSTLPFNLALLIQKNLMKISPNNGSVRASCIRLISSIVHGFISVQKTLSGVENGLVDNIGFFKEDIIPIKTLNIYMKILKRVVEDKSEEVRFEGAMLASALAESAIVSNVSKKRQSRSSKREEERYNLAYLDDILLLSLKNIDDGSSHVANAWSKAVSICLNTAIAYGEKFGHSVQTTDHDLDGDNVANDESSKGSQKSSSDIISKFKAFSETKKVLSINECTSLNTAMKYLCELFIRTGGESVANGCGGAYSVGGRSSRHGISDCIIELLNIKIYRNKTNNLTSSSLKGVITIVLDMVGPLFERQLSLTDAYVSSTNDIPLAVDINPALGTPNKKSTSDAAFARLSVCRVLRNGIGTSLSETNQQVMLSDLTDFCISVSGKNGPNLHQLQCALTEISHLVASLRDASAGNLERIVPLLKTCLGHADYGVRWEAATVYASLANSIPRELSFYVKDLINTVQMNAESIADLADIAQSKSSVYNSDRGDSVRRSRSTSPSPNGKYVTHQYSLHGNALALSMIIHESCNYPSLLTEENVFNLVGISEILILCQFDEKITQSNPGAACTCVRAGYAILSAVVSCKYSAQQYIERIAKCWTRTTKCLVDVAKHFSIAHKVICLEAVLTSIVAFLRFSSDLLLNIPGLLSRITLCLESLLERIVPGGSLSKGAETRFDNIKATIFEAFSWLPPGCFPVASETLYRWAIENIQDCTEKEVQTSLLEMLLSQEDSLVDRSSFPRFLSSSEKWTSSDISDCSFLLNLIPVEHREREGVMHSPMWRNKGLTQKCSKDVLIVGSSFLGLCTSLNSQTSTPPTPLHNVGLGVSWKEPPLPLATSKVRLIDSSIHIFSVTWGLFDGRHQEQAIVMLSELMPASLASSGKFNVGNALLTDTEKKMKTKQDYVMSLNLVAALLAAIQSLPLHEAAISTDSGPPWMHRANEMLHLLLASPYHIVQRGAAECLSALALSTRGIGGGVHGLQQRIVSELEYSADGNLPNGKPRKMAPQVLMRTKATALFALSCIQRQSFRISARRKTSESSNSDMDFLIVSPLSLRIRTCLLSSNIKLTSDEEFSFEFIMYSIHSLQIFLSSSRIDTVSAYGGLSKLKNDRVKLLEKVFMSINSLYVVLWQDDGLTEKLNENALLTAFLRLLSSLISEIELLRKMVPDALKTLLTMAVTIFQSVGEMDQCLSRECMGLIEVAFDHVKSQDFPSFFLVEVELFTMKVMNEDDQILIAAQRQRMITTATICMLLLYRKSPFTMQLKKGALFGRILEHVEVIAGKDLLHSNLYRSVVCRRQPEINRFANLHLSNYFWTSLESAVIHQVKTEKILPTIMKLFKLMTLGIIDDSIPTEHGVEYFAEALKILKTRSNCCWQVKSKFVALVNKIIIISGPEAMQYNSVTADAINIACASCTATSNNEELCHLQLEGASLLYTVLRLFDRDDLQDDSTESSASLVSCTQIAPAIKHSLVNGLENSDLFEIGCSCLRVFAKIGLINDPGMLRRLTKPLLQPNFVVKTEKREDIARTITIAELWFMASADLLCDTVCKSFLREMEHLADEVSTSSSSLVVKICGDEEVETLKEFKYSLPYLCFAAIRSNDNNVIRQVAPIIFAGLYQLNSNYGTSLTKKKNISELLTVWTYGILHIAKSGFVVKNNELIKEVISLGRNLSSKLFDESSIVETSINSLAKYNEKMNLAVVLLIEILCSMEILEGERVALFQAITMSLSRCCCSFSNLRSQKLLAIMLKSVLNLIRNKSELDNIEYVRYFFRKSCDFIEMEESCDEIMESATALVMYCLSSKYMAPPDMYCLISNSARDKKWKLWKILCENVDSELGIIMSIEHFRNVFGSSNFTTIPLALESLCTIAKSKASDINLIQSFMHEVGDAIFFLLKKFGGNSTECDPSASLKVCIECITILSLAFQSLIQKEEDLIQFSDLCFAAFVEVLKSNGLPNQPVGGDVNKGRLCASVLVRWARVSPSAFKASLGNMTDEGRSLVENAVRSEMSGYPAVNKKRILLSR